MLKKYLISDPIRGFKYQPISLYISNLMFGFEVPNTILTL